MSRHVAWTEGQLREAQGRKNTGGWSVEQRGRGMGPLFPDPPWVVPQMVVGTYLSN